MSKVWFITGASSGIGAGIARAALKAGHSVVGTARNIEKANEALGDFAGDRLSIVRLDVTDTEATKAAIAAAVTRFSRIDVAVNNAGYCVLGNFEETTVSEIEAQFATNFYGVVNVMQAVLPIMRGQRSGHILNIGAAGGVIGLGHCSAYCATKFAIEGLAFAVVKEVEKFGIHITTVEPGMFRTDLLDAGNARYVTKAGIEDYAEEGSSETMWSPYHGTQIGDPDRLGTALLEVVAMEAPPKSFVAGSDSLAMIMPGIDQRLAEMREHEALSRSTDGSF